MIEKSRTENAVRNIGAGMAIQILNKVMAFVVRMFFIKILNTEYLGLNGLFTNILNILSFAELGIGTAIIYNIYKPVAENDKEKIKSLMDLYKRCYNIIGCVIFIVGICIIPFLGLIIKDVPNIKENITLIYVLFLINTSSSYFFTYKRAIISAYQKERVINKYEGIFCLIRSVLEIMILILTHNYILYLMIAIITTILMNISISIKTDKMFPFLKDKNIKKLDKKETKSIFSNVKDLSIYKFGSAIMDGTDNIIISSMVNIATVGLCSNYTMIISAVKLIVSSALNGIIGSVGNLNTNASTEKKEKVFYEFQFITFWIYAFCSIALMILLDNFIVIWLGKEYVMNIGIAITLTLSFYITGTRFPAYTYRVTTGMFKKAKVAPFLCAILNVIFSIALGKKFGAIGIFAATSIAQLLSISWIDPYLIHKYQFKTSVKKYFKIYLVDIIIFIGTYIVTRLLASYIPNDGIVGFIIKMIIVIIIPNLIFLITFHKTEEFKATKDRFIKPIVNKIKRKS